MKNLYQHQADSPFHISVGAVLVNEEGKIRTHYRTIKTTPAQFLNTMGGLKESYTLMRETIENGESIESAVHRGLQEEFGAEGEIMKYLGSIQIPELHAKTRTFEKTTLYFQVLFTKQNERSLDDGESHTELVWETPEFLIEKIREQGRMADREDLDESKIIEAYVKHR
jgi:ADP-ribose pyrophosphatase YjhB (NUDIX family)